MNMFCKCALVFAININCCLLYAGWAIPKEIGFIEKAVFTKSNGEIFLRLQASGGIGAPYGAFVFDRNTLKWHTLGNSAVAAVENFAYKGQLINSLQFFNPLKSELFEINYEGKMRLQSKEYLTKVKGTQIQIIEIVNGDSIYYSPHRATGEIDKWWVSDLKHFDGDNLWFTVGEIEAGIIHSVLIGSFDVNTKAFNFLDLDDYGIKGNPGINVIKRYEDELWLGTTAISEGSETNSGKGIFIFDVKDKKILKNITTNNSFLPSNHIVAIKFDGSDTWIATVKGIVLWQRQTGKWYTYQIDKNATIQGDPLRKVGPYTEYTSLGHFREGEVVRLRELFENGFFVSNMETVNGWIYRNYYENGEVERIKIVGDTVTLYGKIDFYSQPDMGSMMIADYRSDDFALTTQYIILETRGDWLEVKLDRLWVPAESVKCKLTLISVNK
jgi:hypothetical protein